MGAQKRLWRLLQPKKVLVWGAELTGAGVAALAFGHQPTIKSIGQIVGIVGLSLIMLAGVMVAAQYIKRRMPEGTSPAATAVIWVGAYAFFVLPPVLLVSLVTSGGSWSALYAAMYDTGGPGGVAQMLGFVRFVCELVSLLILVGVPAVLRRWLPWGIASGMARSLVPSWLAIAAAFTTWLYIFLLHFGGGALAKYPLGLVIVAGLGAAALLAPLFQFVTRSCWEYGSVVVFDPVRWRRAFLAVLDEVRRGRESRVSSKVGKPGPAEDPMLGRRRSLRQSPDLRASGESLLPDGLR
jgi:hypothetical protein